MTNNVQAHNSYELLKEILELDEKERVRRFGTKWAVIALWMLADLEPEE